VDDDLIDERPGEFQCFGLVALGQSSGQVGDLSGVASGEVVVWGKGLVCRRVGRACVAEGGSLGLEVLEPVENGWTASAITDDVHQIANPAVEPHSFALAGCRLVSQRRPQSCPLLIERGDERP
jgi:hypothetical protein